MLDYPQVPPALPHHKNISSSKPSSVPSKGNTTSARPSQNSQAGLKTEKIDTEISEQDKNSRVKKREEQPLSSNNRFIDLIKRLAPQQAGAPQMQTVITPNSQGSDNQSPQAEEPEGYIESIERVHIPMAAINSGSLGSQGGNLLSTILQQGGSGTAQNQMSPSPQSQGPPASPGQSGLSPPSAPGDLVTLVSTNPIGPDQSSGPPAQDPGAGQIQSSQVGGSSEGLDTSSVQVTIDVGEPAPGGASAAAPPAPPQTSQQSSSQHGPLIWDPARLDTVSGSEVASNIEGAGNVISGQSSLQITFEDMSNSDSTTPPTSTQATPAGGNDTADPSGWQEEESISVNVSASSDSTISPSASPQQAQSTGGPPLTVDEFVKIFNADGSPQKVEELHYPQQGSSSASETASSGGAQDEKRDITSLVVPGGIVGTSSPASGAASSGGMVPMPSPAAGTATSGGVQNDNRSIPQLAAAGGMVPLPSLAAGAAPTGAVQYGNRNIPQLAAAGGMVPLPFLPSGPAPTSGIQYDNRNTSQVAVSRGMVPLPFLSPWAAPTGGVQYGNRNIPQLAAAGGMVSLPFLPSGAAPTGGVQYGNRNIPQLAAAGGMVPFPSLVSGSASYGGAGYENRSISQVAASGGMAPLPFLSSGTVPYGGVQYEARNLPQLAAAGGMVPISSSGDSRVVQKSADMNSGPNSGNSDVEKGTVSSFPVKLIPIRSETFKHSFYKRKRSNPSEYDTSGPANPRAANPEFVTAGGAQAGKREITYPAASGNRAPSSFSVNHRGARQSADGDSDSIFSESVSLKRSGRWNYVQDAQGGSVQPRGVRESVEDDIDSIISDYESGKDSGSSDSDQNMPIETKNSRRTRGKSKRRSSLWHDPSGFGNSEDFNAKRESAERRAVKKLGKKIMSMIETRPAFTMERQATYGMPEQRDQSHMMQDPAAASQAPSSRAAYSQQPEKISETRQVPLGINFNFVIPPLGADSFRPQNRKRISESVRITRSVKSDSPAVGSSSEEYEYDLSQLPTWMQRADAGKRSADPSSESEKFKRLSEPDKSTRLAKSVGPGSPKDEYEYDLAELPTWMQRENAGKRSVESPLSKSEQSKRSLEAARIIRSVKPVSLAISSPIEEYEYDLSELPKWMQRANAVKRSADSPSSESGKSELSSDAARSTRSLKPVSPAVSSFSEEYEYDMSELPTWMQKRANGGKRSVGSPSPEHAPDSVAAVSAGARRVSSAELSVSQEATRPVRKVDLRHFPRPKDIRRVLSAPHLQSLFEGARKNLMNLLGGPKDVLDSQLDSLPGSSAKDKGKRDKEMKVRMDSSSLTSLFGLD